MTKDILLTLTYLVGAGELALAVYFWVTRSGNEIRKVMSLLALSTGMWVILSGATSYIEYSQTGYILTIILYSFATFVVTSILHLSLIFPYKLIHLDKLHAWLLYLPNIILIYILTTSRTIVASYSGSSTFSGEIIGGPLLHLYNNYLLLVFLLALGLLAYRMANTDGSHRTLLMITFWSLFFGGLPGAILFLLIATFSKDLPVNTLVGVIPTAIWVFGVGYVLRRR